MLLHNSKCTTSTSKYRQLFFQRHLSSDLLRTTIRHNQQQPAALEKFIQDLNTSQSELAEEEEELTSELLPRRRSEASQYGSTRLPIIQLPSNLISGVQELVQTVAHRSTIRTSALGLYGKYRITSSKDSLNQSSNHLMDSFLSDTKSDQLETTTTTTQKNKNKIIKPKLSTSYDHLTSISFAAGAMPSHYGATLKVLLELKRRSHSDQARRGSDTEWFPKSIIDYGAGTGSAIWSALQVWPDGIKNYTALDKSRSMIWLNQKLLENITKKENSINNSKNSNNNNYKNKNLLLLKSSNLLTTKFKNITISSTENQKLNLNFENKKKKLIDEVEKLELTNSNSSEIDLKPSKEDWIEDSDGLLAIMSFTLTDLANQASRRQAIEGMWNSGAETMVIIDRGTPAGFQVVAEARQQLLMLGRRAVRNSTKTKENNVNNNNNNTSNQLENEKEEENEKTKNSNLIQDLNQGSWVLAPCPHDKPCPLHLSDNPKHFCHFSQRIERPQFLKLTKHTSKQEEDSKFSYVIIKRGSRIPPAPLPRVSSESSSDLSKIQGDNEQEDTHEFSKGDALEWPRIILPPHKCKGHVIFDVCATSGEIERMTIPRSQGKQAYYDARKTFWGDLWPHGSKKPGLVKALKGRNGNRGDRRRKKKEILSANH